MSTKFMKNFMNDKISEKSNKRGILFLIMIIIYVKILALPGGLEPPIPRLISMYSDQLS